MCGVVGVKEDVSHAQRTAVAAAAMRRSCCRLGGRQRHPARSDGLCFDLTPSHQHVSTYMHSSKTRSTGSGDIAIDSTHFRCRIETALPNEQQCASKKNRHHVMFYTTGTISWHTPATLRLKGHKHRHRSPEQHRSPIQMASTGRSARPAR